MTTQIKRLLVSALKTIEQQSGTIAPAARPKSREGKKTLVFHVEPAAAWQLKKLALDRQMTVQKLLEESLSDLFEKHHLPGL